MDHILLGLQAEVSTLGHLHMHMHLHLLIDSPVQHQGLIPLLAQGTTILIQGTTIMLQNTTILLAYYLNQSQDRQLPSTLLLLGFHAKHVVG